MPKSIIVRHNAYFDSVTLMTCGSTLKKIEGVVEAVVAMGTELNKEILRSVGLSNEDTESAGPNDFIIAIEAASEKVCATAREEAEKRLCASAASDRTSRRTAPKTIREAVQGNPRLGVAVISVPGRYAARETMQALEQGLNVMLFSDNMSLDDERRCKSLAREKGLLVMGPDCGTALINGVGLCFANAVQPGPIGLVAASGTGAQEIMAQIDRHGGGISHVIGTGGRDVSEAIGGDTMEAGIDLLSADRTTEVIVVVSKPPARAVEERLMQKLSCVEKPVVACFLEGDCQQAGGPSLHLVDNMEEAAEVAVSLTASPAAALDSASPFWEQATEAGRTLTDRQRFARGFFCGGTLCAEAAALLRDSLGPLYCNASHRADEEIPDITQLTGTVLLDMGDDQFTNGRPHPMIDPTLRNEWILRQAHDPTVGVVLLDFEIGYGCHSDPAGEALDALLQAKREAASHGRNLVFVGYVLGTKADRQGLKAQQEKLKEAGVILGRSNREAAHLVATVLTSQKKG